MMRLWDFCVTLTFGSFRFQPSPFRFRSLTMRCFSRTWTRSAGLLSTLALATLAPLSTPALAEMCPGPSLWFLAEKGIEAKVLKEGTGLWPIQGSSRKIPAIGLVFSFTTPDGQTGTSTLWGPMRSYMFRGLPEPEMTTQQGFTWGPASKDEGGHYTVRSDDGNSILFNMYFEKCL